MNHEEIRSKLSELYDGELPEAEKSEVRSHLKGCGECAQSLSRMQAASASLFRIPPIQVRESFVQDVMERLRADEKPARRTLTGVFARWLVPAAAMGLAAYIFFVSIPQEEIPVSTEALLLVNGREGEISEWVFLPIMPDADEFLGYTLEEP